MIKWQNLKKKVHPAPDSIRKDRPIRLLWREFNVFFGSMILVVISPFFHPTNLSVPIILCYHVSSDFSWSFSDLLSHQIRVCGSKGVGTACTAVGGVLHFFHISCIELNIQANTYSHTNVWFLTLQQEILTKTLTTAVRSEEQQASRGVLVCASIEYEIQRSHILSFSLRFSHARTCTLAEKALCPNFSVLFSSLSHYIGFHDGDLVKAPLQRLEPVVMV